MSKLKYIFMVLAGMGLPLVTQAQDASDASFYEQNQLEIVLGIAVLTVVVALVALITALYAINTILNVKNAAEAEAEGREPLGFWANFWDRFNSAVPLEEEETVMTDHAYDGIRELDNRLPPWWLYGFYFTILFGVGYLIYCHGTGAGDLSAAEYDKEMARAEEEVQAYLASQGGLIDESSVELLTADAEIAAGKEIFMANCAACHGMNGEGTVGPNLTDKYWIHGGDIKSIFKTIKYGVPAKGMIPWESQLGPSDMQKVASYIYTLEGTNPPNPKDPQGDLFEREGASTDSTEAAAEDTTEVKVVLEAGM